MAGNYYWVEQEAMQHQASLLQAAARHRQGTMAKRSRPGRALTKGRSQSPRGLAILAAVTNALIMRFTGNERTSGSV